MRRKKIVDIIKSLKEPCETPKDNDSIMRMNASKRIRKAEMAMNIVNKIA